MSVTFAPVTVSLPATFGIECYEQGRIGSAATYEGGLEVRSTHMAACEECNLYGCFVSSEVVGYDVPEVNVSNQNARDILRTLDLDSEDLSGGCSAEDFMGRVLVALAVEPEDTGVRSLTTQGAGGATFIDCGRPAGYVQDRLAGLRQVAAFAAEHGLEVQWA